MQRPKLAGAIPAALLGLMTQFLFEAIERMLQRAPGRRQADLFIAGLWVRVRFWFYHQFLALLLRPSLFQQGISLPAHRFQRSQQLHAQRMRLRHRAKRLSRRGLRYIQFIIEGGFLFG